MEAAWRTGVGTVRLWAPRRVQDLVLARRPETVCHALDEPPEGVDAWVLGSGQDARERDEALRALLRACLGGGRPAVVDAGALDLVPGHEGPAVVTPHEGELARILGRERDALGDRDAAAGEAARALDAIVVAKGVPTFVATPAGALTTVHPPTHRLATAGTGDVLAGVLGAVVAGSAREAADPGALASMAALAVRLHGAAAALAAQGGRSVTALDVAERLPEAVAAARAD